MKEEATSKATARIRVFALVIVCLGALTCAAIALYRIVDERLCVVQLRSSSRAIRVQAINRLGTINSSVARRQLLGIVSEAVVFPFSEDSDAYHAAKAMVQCGPDGIAELFNYGISHKRISVGIYDALFKGMTSGEAEVVWHIILERLAGESYDERISSALLLPWSAGPPSWAVEKLLLSLADENLKVRICVALCLNAGQVRTKETLCGLLEAAEEGWAGAQAQALRALYQIGAPTVLAILNQPNGRECVEGILKILSEYDPRMSQAYEKEIMDSWEVINNEGR